MPVSHAPIESEHRPCDLFVVVFDFETKTDRRVPLTEAQDAAKNGLFVWLDLKVSDGTEAREILTSLEFLETEVIDDVLTRDASTQCARYERFIHGVASSCKATEVGFELDRVDYFIAENYFVTVHRTDVAFLAAVKREYHADFVRFAKTSSFLVYEFWDQLLDSYLSVQKVMEHRVESLAARLRSGSADDSVFTQTAELGADLLHFRKVVLPARAVLAELATRRTVLLSEATQVFLGNMSGTVEHVLQDLLVDKDILSESLNLHMSLMGHRTNQVMGRLTAVSIVFLPLSFLAGVYGMNFSSQPELHWKYGYVFFWVIAALAVAGIVYWMKRGKML